ncbi:prepilin-type N-terminal cleavage/methylation domain-containing protein [uncultured Arthrobacter sp.]|uniref:prepilin-type N-terminal cleavage/methylation domain-containing protein n=1 Tax=uncultured Arthrobacter sp. TaxID=114050 RepID=UPI00321640E3
MASFGTSRHAGVTLIELTIVLLLAAVLAAAVAPRWYSAGEATVGFQIDRLARDLRHAQALAHTQGRTLRVNVESTRYCVTLAPATDCAQAIRDPATGAPFVVPLEHDVTLSGTSTELDSLGRPKDGTLLAAARVFRLTAGETAWSAVLRPLTGFVEVKSP